MKIILTALFLLCMEPVAGATVLLDSGVGLPDAGPVDPDRPPPPPPDLDATRPSTPPQPTLPLTQGGLTAVASVLVGGLTALLKRRRFWSGLSPKFRPFMPLLIGVGLSAVAWFSNLVPADVAAASAALSGAAAMGFYQLGKRRRRQP
jgi:hypothetical protein